MPIIIHVAIWPEPLVFLTSLACTSMDKVRGRYLRHSKSNGENINYIYLYIIGLVFTVKRPQYDSSKDFEWILFIPSSFRRRQKAHSVMLISFSKNLGTGAYSLKCHQGKRSLICRFSAIW